MAQAKVLNEKETRRVLLYIASKKHSARNRCMFLMTANCGMRVGEVAELAYFGNHLQVLLLLLMGYLSQSQDP